MRCTQEMGLNRWAQRFIRGKKILAYTEYGVRKYPDGRMEPMAVRPVFEPSVKCEPSGEHYMGMFEDEVYDLHRYTFPDGRVFVEKVQAAQQSSGPVIFLALQDATGAWVRPSLWGDKEIENA